MQSLKETAKYADVHIYCVWCLSTSMSVSKDTTHPDSISMFVEYSSNCAHPNLNQFPSAREQALTKFKYPESPVCSCSPPQASVACYGLSPFKGSSKESFASRMIGHHLSRNTTPVNSLHILFPVILVLVCVLAPN
jgi:hypothetical protein